MTSFILQIGLSNALLALTLAFLAMVVSRTLKRPHLAHTLWVLVFDVSVQTVFVDAPVQERDLETKN